MKKLSTILLAVLIGVLCVLSTGAAGDFIFWDFSDEAVVAQWNPNTSTGVDVTPDGARVYGKADTIGFNPDFSGIILDNYQYVVIEYTGANYDGRMQLYHNGIDGVYYYLQRSTDISEGVHRHVFDFETGDTGTGNAYWKGEPNFARFDVIRGNTDFDKEITIKYVGFFANKAQFDAFGPYIASDFGIYNGDNEANATEVVAAGSDVALTVKAPSKYVFANDYTVTWNTYTDDIANAMPVADGATLAVDTSVAGEAYYFANVSCNNGTESYTSDPIKVVVCDEATYADYTAHIADAYALFENDAVAEAITSVSATKPLTFKVKGPIEFIFDAYTVEWFRNGQSVGAGKTFTVAPDAVEGYAMYKAVVLDSEGGVAYESTEVIVCDEETYNDYTKHIAAGYDVYNNDAVAAGSFEIYIGNSIELSVKGPSEYIFDGYTVEWFCNGQLVAAGKDITVAPVEASSDYDSYYAVVSDAEGNVVYTSETIRVFGCEEINPPIVYDAETLGALTKNTANGKAELVAGLAEDGVGYALQLTPTADDPGVSISGLNVDLATYPLMVLKLRSNVDQSLAAFHYFNRSNGNNQTGASGSHYQTAGFSYGAYQYVKVSLDMKDALAVTYTGMRFDFFNNGGINLNNDKMDLEFIGFFTGEEQFKDFCNAGEQVIVPEPDGKFWQFADDASFTSDLFADATYVAGEGAKLVAGNAYVANIKTRDKFDLEKFSVVKFFYNAAADTTLSIYNNGDLILSETLAAAADSATFDFRNIWSGEFGALEFVVDNEITISAIGYFTNENAANLYYGDADIATADGDLEYEGAIWWNFADTNIFYKLQSINAEKKFNINSDNGMPNTISFVAKEDGDFNFSYSKIHMYYDTILSEAEQYPYIVLGYNSAAVAGKPAYIKFKSELSDTPVIVNFTWPADEDNYNGCLFNVGTDANGYNKLFVNFASLTNLQSIDPTVASEWRGAIEYVEIGVDGLTAGDELEVAYINFFEFDTHAQTFDGAVKVNPVFLESAKWSTKETVIAEYVTVKDLDLDAEVITFSVDDYSRISRFTLTDLKKNYPSKKVVVDGDVYDLEFYPKNVDDNMLTWYYDLEVSFDGTNAGDVYRETVKNLITEGDYITGVYFLQKFVKDRSMPFKGKLIYDIGEAFNGKYLDIYKYDYRENTVALVERAPVKEGKITITTLGGDLAIVDSGYQPSEEELKRAEAIDVYENTPWNALIFDCGDESSAGLEFKANNAEIKTNTKSGVTYNSVTSTKEGTRIELMLRPVAQFEASEYPVMVVKYKTSVNFSGAVNNYVSTDYYAAGVGYEWFKTATYYNATGAYAISPSWTTKVIDYTNGDTMKASGLAISGEYTEGKTSSGSVAYPFKGALSEYRLDFNVGPVGTTVDIAYVAFFANAEEAQKYIDARNVIDGFTAEEVKAEEEKANANKPQYYVFDLTDSKEANKYTFAGATESQPTKTESKHSADGLWMKDADGEFNITRLLGEEDQFELSEYPVLKIKVKYSIPGVTSQLYVWNTAQVGINPRCELLVEKGGEWTEQIWDFSKENMALGTWNGVLTKFRLDPMRGAGAVEREATVAYIGFFKTVEDAQAFNGAKK